MSGTLFCLIGPSGVGKTTIKNFVINKYGDIHYLPSITTRLPRETEIDGKDYYFVSSKEFSALIREQKLVEWEKHFDHYYGISKEQLEKKLDAGVSLIKEVAIGGYKQILESVKNKNRVFSIYIEPENLSDVLGRLQSRGDKDLDIRVRSFEEELQAKDLCDRIVVSKHNQLDVVCEEVAQIIQQKLAI